jgi:hypothetical protein
VVAGHLGVGGGPLGGAETEQGLKGSHGRPAAVVAKYELVEVDLQVRVADPAVGAVKPGL